MPCDAQARHVDVLCFTEADTDSAVQPVDHPAGASDTEGAVPPVAVETDAKNNDDDVRSNSSEEINILDYSAPPEDAHADRLETHRSIADIKNEDEQQASKHLDDGGKAEALETTSAHDDWLHRGKFLWHMDFHTYIRFTLRQPRPKDQKVSDTDRAEHCFLFDSHYALALSHWQQLVTDGQCRLVVMEALKCPLPSVNNGEDNAVIKSLIGTLIKCPGPGHCADPLFCKAGFFQVTVAESSTQIPASELSDWIDHNRFTPYQCPLRISRTTHADNVPATFSCRLQWKARRAEIEVLAKQAADLSHDAKRIPVLADTTLVRGFQSGSAARLAGRYPAAEKTLHGDSAAQPVCSPPTWRFLVCFTQVWLQKSGEAFPPFARTVLDYMGNSIHHPHQLSLAQFSAYHLRETIYNLDMLAIARTTKLTTTSKESLKMKQWNQSTPPDRRSKQSSTEANKQMSLKTTTLLQGRGVQSFNARMPN